VTDKILTGHKTVSFRVGVGVVIAINITSRRTKIITWKRTLQSEHFGSFRELMNLNRIHRDSMEFDGISIKPRKSIQKSVPQ